MKKVLSLTFIMIFLSTSISFSQQNNNVVASVKNLSIVDNNLELIIKNILSGEYDEESMKKDLNFNESLISNIY